MSNMDGQDKQDINPPSPGLRRTSGNGKKLEQILQIGLKPQITQISQIRTTATTKENAETETATTARNSGRL